MENLWKDIRFLTETLEHRQTSTEEEERAADYVMGRLAGYVDHVQKSRCKVVDNFRMVMGAYYGEMVVTCILAFWWPLVALVYGSFVFIAYVAEIIGYPVFSRLLAYYESSCVSGFTLGRDTEKLLVFTAYLDTDNSPIADSSGLPLIRFFHRAIMAGMILVLATCTVDAFGSYTGTVNPFTWWIRLACLVVFTLTAVGLFLVTFGTDSSQGANHNASGIAALLEIAARVRQEPLGNASVLFYFAGGHFANMAGMRRLVSEIKSSGKETYIINLEGVGAGDLCYTETEGVLMRAACSQKLIKAAESLAEQYNARSARVLDYATNAYLPLIRGLKVISVLGLDDYNLPVNYGADEDIRIRLDPDAILQAARFAESIGRAIVEDQV